MLLQQLTDAGRVSPKQSKDTQHTTHNTQHTTHNTLHTAHNTQHTTHNTQHTDENQNGGVRVGGGL